MGYVRRVVVFAAVLLVVAVDARRSDASPITWQYTGSVTSSFNPQLVPQGTPAMVLVTVDPVINLAIGAFDRPANGGSYEVTADIRFLGLEYVYFAAFEVNWDVVHDFPQPGFIRVVPLSVSGPPLDPTVPSPFYRVGPGCCGQNFAYLYGASADASSPAFPGPLPVADFALHFLNFGPTDGIIRVTAVDLEAVPEPASGALLLTGVLGLALRRRRRRA
jgi:hypothetical protein